jgi:hypothetical protein
MEEIAESLWKPLLEKPQPKDDFAKLSKDFADASGYLLGETPAFFEFSVGGEF